jgi:hypothetical protein
VFRKNSGISGRGPYVSRKPVKAQVFSTSRRRTQPLLQIYTVEMHDACPSTVSDSAFAKSGDPGNQLRGFFRKPKEKTTEVYSL